MSSNFIPRPLAAHTIVFVALGEVKPNFCFFVLSFPKTPMCDLSLHLDSSKFLAFFMYDGCAACRYFEYERCMKSEPDEQLMKAMAASASVADSSQVQIKTKRSSARW